MSKVYVDGQKFRVDVFTEDFEKALTTIERLGAPKKMIIDRGVVTVDGAKYRVDVFTGQYETVMEQIKKVKA